MPRSKGSAEIIAAPQASSEFGAAQHPNPPRLLAAAIISELPKLAQAEAENAYFAALDESWLDPLLALAQQAHSHPWTRANFTSAMRAGCAIQLLIHAPEHDAAHELIGYFVAMRAADEVHLLDLAIAAPRQRQGWARLLLDALALWARQQQAQSLWLEVRQSNARARAIYSANGFAEMGLRKNYYPARGTQREHAVLMQRPLWPTTP